LEQNGFVSLSTTESGLIQNNTNPYTLPRLMADDAPDLAGQIMLLHTQQFFVGGKKKELAQ
jgi:hypothetical protein